MVVQLWQDMVFVKMLTGKKIGIPVDFESTTVHKLKLLVQEREGIPPDQQRVIFGTEQLVDELLLSDYNVKPESVLRLVLRLRGGELSQPCTTFYG